MKTSRIWIAVPLVLLLAACADDDADTDVVLDDAEREAPAAEQSPGPAQMPMQPSGAMMAQTASFRALQNSGAGGEATITGRGQQTEVMVRLTGGTANASHPGHIHSGTCDAIGGVVQPLQPVTTDASGSGTVTATVDVPAMTAMNGQHVVVYHAAQGGSPIACAQIPAHAM